MANCLTSKTVAPSRPSGATPPPLAVRSREREIGEPARFHCGAYIGKSGHCTHTAASLCVFPCKSVFAASAMIGTAVADERPMSSWAAKPEGERGSSSAVPSNPNSRKGRKRSPILQGREAMDARFVGIDVSKHHLQVHTRP